MTKHSFCKICGNNLTDILSLGKIPLVNYYPNQKELKKDRRHTLTFTLCTTCGLTQLKQSIKPKKIFSTYHYASGTSSPLKEHLEKLADFCIKLFKLSEKNSVLDIGCNDGIFLKKLKEKQISILGIDPAQNIAKDTQKKGVPVVVDFFTSKLANKLLKKQKKFDLIVATNTLAQSIEPSDFISGVRNILKPNGTFVIEVGYVLDMILKKTFDSIYHEHYSYFSLASLSYLLRKHNLKIIDVQHIANHGGSLRVFAVHEENKKSISKRFIKLLAKEKTYHLENPTAYSSFVTSVVKYKKHFRKKIINIKKHGKHIIGIGSPAKSVVLLNYCNITTKEIDFVVDSTSYKQYKFMPGTHIPIFPEENLQKTTADYFLLLAWTYRDTLLKKLSVYKNKKVIIPFPQMKIITL